MKKFLNITLLAVGIILLFITLHACGSNNKDTSEEVAANTSNAEDHEDEESDIVEMTQDQIKAVGVKLAALETKNLTANITANGLLRVPNQNKADITSLYGGVIKSLRVELGERVSKGQIVATIENPQFVLLQEEYITIGSRIMQAEQELARQQELNEGNAGARRNLQNATAELTTLRTRRASLRQQIQMMGINPDKVNDSNLQNLLQITSPVNGIISNVYAKVGSYVDVSAPIAEVVDNNQLHLDLQIFEKDLPKVKIGQIINFNLTNNPSNTYKAKVYNIGSSFQNDSKTIAVHSIIQGDKTGLIDGMNVTAALSLSNVQMLAVPNDAIIEANGSSYIFIQVDPEGKHEHDKGQQDQNEKGHVHQEGETHDHAAENKKSESSLSFERFEVAKGVSYMGYTAITPVKELPKNAQVAISGGFFMNAKLNDAGEDAHGH